MMVLWKITSLVLVLFCSCNPTWAQTSDAVMREVFGAAKAAIPNISGTNIVGVNKHLSLQCQVNRNASQFTFYWTKFSNKCLPENNFTKWTQWINDTLLVLDKNISKEYYGHYRIICAKKQCVDKVHIGVKEIKVYHLTPGPDSVECVNMNSESLKCSIHPSFTDLRRRYVGHMDFSVRLHFLILKNDVICCRGPSCQCKITDSGKLMYGWKIRCERFVLMVETKMDNVVLNSTTFHFNSCSILKLTTTLSLLEELRTNSTLSFEWSPSRPIYMETNFDVNLTCEANEPLMLTYNKIFMGYKSPQILNMAKMKPGIEFICRAQIRPRKFSENYGDFSAPVTATTLSSLPDSSPIVKPAMAKKRDGYWVFYFMPIPPFQRNGKIRRYKMQLGQMEYFSSLSNTFKVPDDDNTRSSSEVSFSGENDAGWSDSITVPFDSFTMSQTKVELEIWKIRETKYQLSYRINTSLPFIDDVQLLYCYCGSPERCQQPLCTEITQKTFSKDAVEDIDLAKERIAVILSSRKLNYSWMSDFVGCTYNRKDERPFKKLPTVRIDEGFVIVDVDRCSEYFRSPPNILYKRYLLNDGSFSSISNISRPVGTDYFKFPITKNYGDRKLQLSFNNLNYTNVGNNPTVESETYVILGAAIPFILIVSFIIFYIIIFRRGDLREMLIRFARTIRSNPTLEGHTSPEWKHPTYYSNASIPPGQTEPLRKDEKSNEQTNTDSSSDKSSSKYVTIGVDSHSDQYIEQEC